jgi:hypothetical protein
LGHRAVLPLGQQTLKITSFFGIWQNAGRIQIAIAQIALLLLRLRSRLYRKVRSSVQRPAGKSAVAQLAMEVAQRRES